MTRRQKTLNAILCAAAAGTAAASAATVGRTATASAAVQTTTVQRGVVQSTVTASGNVQAPTSISVNFKSGGRLTAVYVQAGQYAKRGQLLARVDDSSSQQTLRSAEANLKSAKAQLAKTVQGQTPAQKRQAEVEKKLLEERGFVVIEITVLPEGWPRARPP